MVPQPLTESDIRALRDRVLEQHCSDITWNHVRKNWLQPEETRWLVEHDWPTNEAAQRLAEK